MEDILGFVIVIIGLIASIASSAKKKQTKSTTFPPVSKSQESAPASAPASMSSMLPQVTPMQPTVHTHTTPDCPTHDTPGSLGVKSAEGKDPCHEEQLAAQPVNQPAAPIANAAPAISFDWSSENMVKAFVMQEVLTRPCQRRAAR